MGAVSRIQTEHRPRVGTGGALEPIETPAVVRRKRAKRARRPRGTKSGGNRGERQCPPVTGPRASPADVFPPLPVSPETQRLWWQDDIAGAYVAERLGFDLPDVLEVTHAPDRHRIGAALAGHVFTKRRHKKPASVLDHEWTSEPVDRSIRILSCGHLRPAYRGNELGVAHWHCKDRLCPYCAERRAREYSSAARAFIADRVKAKRFFVGGDDGLRVLEHRVQILFCTLTQLKQPTKYETAQQSYDRLMGTWRRMQNSKSKLGREFAKHFVGGARAVELKYSQKGDKHGAHVVKYSGWHPHLHCLFEVRWGVNTGDAIRCMHKLWQECSPTSTGAGRDVQLVDNRRVGQLCKYPLKLPELVNVETIREAAKVLADRKTLVGFGTWRGFLKEGRALRDDGKADKAPLCMADQRISTLCRRDGVVSFTARKGKMWEVRIMDLRFVRDAILKDPRTFDQRDRDTAALHKRNAQKLAEDSGARVEDEFAPVQACETRREWWDNFAPPPLGPPPDVPRAPEPEQTDLWREEKRDKLAGALANGGTEREREPKRATGRDFHHNPVRVHPG